MKAELYKRLFRAIFSEDISSLKKIAITIIQEVSSDKYTDGWFCI